MPLVSDPPYVSILIVTYNYERYLSKTLDACRRQTFQDFEIVLVDNGSTDSTPKIIEEFIRKNPELHVRPIRIDVNEGCAKGRNAAIDAARGEYVLFNDADDWMDDDCLEELAGIARETGADRIVGDYRHIDEKDMRTLWEVRYAKDNVKWYTTMLQGSLFKRSIFEEYQIRDPLDLFVEDVYLAIQFASHAKDYRYSQKVQYNVLRHATSATGSNTFKGLENTERIHKDVFRICFDMHDQSDDPTDRMYLEYFCIKTYYHNFFHFGQGASAKELLSSYERVRRRLIERLPNYLENKNVGLLRGHDNLHGKVIIWASNRLEKLHLFKPALVAYGLLTRFVHFEEKV